MFWRRALCKSRNNCTSTRFKYYTGLKVRAKKHFYGRCAAVMSFSEAFFALLPPLHALLRGDRRAHWACSELTTCASDERVYGPSARLPDEPAHMGCRMLAYLRDGGVYRCSGRGACNDACAAADGPVRVLVLGALLRAAQRPVEF